MMKKIKTLLLTFLALISLTACGGNKEPSEPEVVNPAASNVQVVLNLTSVGLYKDAKGEKNDEYFLENTVTISTTVGAQLPGAEDITSTSKDTVFKTWVYYKEGGLLTATDKVISGITVYQAHFEYTGKFESDPDDPVIGTSDKIYFISANWWNADGATTSFYSWGGNKTYTWPGTVMHLEETLSDGKKVWSIEVDINSLTGFIFARTGSGAAEGSLAADWGAKTPDLTAANFGSNNCAIMTDEVIWGNPGVNLKYSTYVPGKTNY